jgi:hypothetical protein
MPLVSFIGPFFLVGFALIVGGLLFGSRSTVVEGSKAVGQGCLWIIGIIVGVVILISILESS